MAKAKQDLQTFLMLGNYSSGAISSISAGRTQEAKGIVKEFGGKVIGIYGLLGDYDVMFLVGLPDLTAAMQLSVKLGQMTGISFSTYPAVDVATFDKAISEVVVPDGDEAERVRVNERVRVRVRVGPQ